MGRITTVPPAYETAIVERVCEEIDAARENITTEASWQRLGRFFYNQLLEGGQTLPTSVVLAWAEAGHPAADRALRLYAATMTDRGRWDELVIQVRATSVKTLVRPFVPYPQGRHVVQHLMRDIGSGGGGERSRRHGPPATRAASTETPSAAYFVSLALKRCGFKCKEREVNRIHWGRNNLAAQLKPRCRKFHLPSNKLFAGRRFSTRHVKNSSPAADFGGAPGVVASYRSLWRTTSNSTAPSIVAASRLNQEASKHD